MQLADTMTAAPTPITAADTTATGATGTPGDSTVAAPGRAGFRATKSGLFSPTGTRAFPGKDGCCAIRSYSVPDVARLRTARIR